MSGFDRIHKDTSLNGIGMFSGLEAGTCSVSGTPRIPLIRPISENCLESSSTTTRWQSTLARCLIEARLLPSANSEGHPETRLILASPVSGRGRIFGRSALRGKLPSARRRSPGARFCHAACRPLVDNFQSDSRYRSRRGAYPDIHLADPPEQVPPNCAVGYALRNSASPPALRGVQNVSRAGTGKLLIMNFQRHQVYRERRVARVGVARIAPLACQDANSAGHCPSRRGHVQDCRDKLLVSTQPRNDRAEVRLINGQIGADIRIGTFNRVKDPVHDIRSVQNS